MRIANLDGRLTILTADEAIDVERASDGRFSSDPQAVYDDWSAFRQWSGPLLAERTGERADAGAASAYDETQLLAPTPRPRQIFAIGLNYKDHAAESKLDLPSDPVVFTKFASSITSPAADVTLPSDNVDYEVELVVVIGTGGHRIPASEAWDHVAGLTVGQDISERVVQSRGPAPQFSLGKSYPGFAPLGPCVVTPDEFENPDALHLTTQLVSDGETRTLQDGSTADLIFPVPELIARLSEVLELYPGDIIFTGTPAGVGLGKNPPEYLRRGEQLVTTIEGIGTLRNRLV